MSDKPISHDESLRSLIEAVINGEASEAQHQRLEKRLLDDQQARDAWLKYANLHASLSGWFLASDSGVPLEGDIPDLTLTMSRKGLVKSNAIRSYVGWMGAIVAVCLLMVVGVYQVPWFRSLIETPLVDGPTIVQLAGDIQIHSADGRTVEATDHRAVRLGETVVSNSDEDRVVLQYADGTEIVLLGDSALEVTHSLGGGKLLKLNNGLLQALVTPQPVAAPLLIVTPQTRVRVLGTRFELSTNEQDGTRLELETGELELVRGEEQPVKVEPNSIAIVPTTRDPIRVFPRPVVVDTPQRETVFRGLESVTFSEDGSTLVASTGWQALFWYEDDRLEVVPLSTRGRKGIRFQRQANSRLAYFDQQERKIKIWDTQSRQSQSVFENVAELREQFPSSPKRPKDWNPISKLAVMSPKADWLAFQVGREFRVWQHGNDRWPEFPRNYDGKFVGALASSPDGETLAVAVRRGKVDLVDVKTGEVKTTWSLQQKIPFAMEFSADGKHLAVSLAGHVAVHDVTTGDVLAHFEQSGLPFIKVAISGDGRFVAASSLSDRVWMWDVTSRVELPLLDIGGPIQELTFAPSGDHLVVLSRGGRLSVWKVQDASSVQSSTETDSR